MMVKGVYGTVHRPGQYPRIDEWVNEWSSHPYPPYLKKKLQEYDRKNEIGKIVLDLGSGPNPLSFTLSTPEKIVLVDIVPMVKSLKKRGKQVVSVWADIEEMLEHDTYGHLSKYGPLDTIVASSIFNYLDWKKLLGSQREFHSKGGNLFIANMAGIGIKGLFSDSRPSSVSDIVNGLPETGYRVVEVIEKGIKAVIVAKKI
jgi:hypothetical protein